MERRYYQWASHAEDVEVFSIPHYVENNAERIRARYLAFIHNLGNKVIDDRRLVEHLELSAGFSMWWMSLIAEKNLYKSGRIVDCFKLLALEEILQRDRPKSITLYGVKDEILADAIKAFCRNVSVQVDFSGGIKKTTIGRDQGIRRFYYNLPHSVRGLMYLIRYVINRWSLRGIKNVSWFSEEKSIFFMSYFVHLDTEKCSDGHFYSHHWEVLPAMLNEQGVMTNWIHHFMSWSAVPDTRTGLDWLARFNGAVDCHGRHSFLDSYLTVGVVARAIANWMRIAWRSFRLCEITDIFYPGESSCWLWPLLQDDWYSSTRGVVAAQNALCVELFDAALDDLPKQQVGLYLYEGQGWERAFINAWRKHGHGELIAVAHSTVRYWDIRYFDDPRTVRNKDPLNMPQADCIAVNGPVFFQEYLDAGYPKERLVTVEALRYLKLSGITALKKKSKKVLSPKTKRVLVLGDILPKATAGMLNLLAALPENLRNTLEIVVKAHPSSIIQKAEYPYLDFELSTEPLYKILDQFDIAYGANPSTANLEAYLAGLSVLVHLDEDGINFSPLRGVAGVKFVSSTEELEAMLQEGRSLEEEERESIFYLNVDLPRWRTLLGCWK